MANRRLRDVTYEKASIDTAPGTAGYYTTAVKPLSKHGNLVMFITGTWAGTVTLQFRPKGNTGWTAYSTTWTANARQIIEDATDCEWRIGIASGGYTSGTVVLGIEYVRY